MKIAIYSQPTDSYGILVIIENLIRVSKQKRIPCRHITSLSDAQPDETIIPYGTLEPIEMINKGLVPKVSLLVDAISLGAKNKIIHYLRVGHFLHKDFLGTVPRYIKWRSLDKKIARNIDNVILVSTYDGEYLRRFNKNLHIIVCPNGARVVVGKNHTFSQKLRLGILSSWATENTYEENNWFVRKYYLRYAKSNPNVELVLAGRGQLLSRMKGLPQVTVMGEIADLADFFANIDIFVAANPKGCGILNRCLDAFSYQVPVIGCQAAFSGFTYMKDSFLTFNSYRQFVNSVVKLKDNKELQVKLVKNASSQIAECNNWEENLGNMLDEIVKLSEEK